jgi:HAMP domain-containing protein
MFARNWPHRETGQNSKKKQRWATNLTIGKRLLLLFTLFFIAMGSVLTFVYMKYVPALMHNQINLRTFSISTSFSAAIQQPLLVKNYLLVNKIAEANARLPGVAYVAVINKKGIVVAGIIGDQMRFNTVFVQKVEEEGFPQDMALHNRIPTGKSENAMDLSMGGQKIHDVAVSIGDTGGESHVGLFVEDVEKEVRESLTPLLMLLTAMALIGGISFFLVAKTISTPIKTLTQAAERISLGEIDFPIKVKTKGEIGDLAASLDRMRSSIKVAISRLQKNGR